MNKKEANNRLPRNFHKTFKPERQYINAMLRYAASGQSGDYLTIAAATGIPTGKSSGKVPAILDYCRGMGLIKLAGTKLSAVKLPELTHFGRIVLLEDPFMKCGISQWIAHFNMCSPLSGADIWYHTFFVGLSALGQAFTREKLEAYLQVVYGISKIVKIGPIVGMYEDEAAFKNCGALSEEGGIITRKPAPISDEYGNGYGAWLLQLISEHFPNQMQVSLAELNTVAGWRTIPYWNITELIKALALIERKGFIDVDRHMEPWIVSVKKNPEKTWRAIYNDMI